MLAGRLARATRSGTLAAVIVAVTGRRPDPAGAPEARFPVANREAVAMHLERLLARLRPGALVASAACGADLIALDVARQLRIRRRIVLPCAPDQFRDASVTDRPGDWAE